MQLLTSSRHLLWATVLGWTLAANVAQAETLPWLAQPVADPFGSEKKATGLVAADLKPDSCGRQPDTNRKLTFNEIVVASLCHNPDTRAAYLSLVGQAASYAGNYAGYLPTSTASYSHGRSTFFGENSKSTLISSSYGVTLGMTLYDFGQREFKVESAELALVAAGHSYHSTLQGAIGAALRGYDGLLTAQNGLAVARESENYAKSSYDAAKLRHQIGQVPLADELQAKGAYSQA
jgi:outer membrane protein